MSVKMFFYTKKCLRYPTNRIQNKNHREELMKSTKFPCLTSMIKFILDTGIDELASWCLYILTNVSQNLLYFSV